MGLFGRKRRTQPLTPAAAAAGAGRGDLLLIDVREPDEYQSGHAPEAVNVPLGQIGSVLDELAGQSTDIAFVCRSGARSGLAVKTAAGGEVSAQNVEGGMLAWEREGLPTTAGKGPRLPKSS